MLHALYKVVLAFESVDEILWCDHSNERQVVQYLPMVLFIMLYKVALASESVDEILECDHSNESYWAVLSRDAVYICVYYAVQGGSNLLICGWNHRVWPFNQKAFEQYSCGTVYYDVQDGSTVWVCGWYPKVWPLKWKLVSSTFLWCWNELSDDLRSLTSVKAFKGHLIRHILNVNNVNS